MPRCRVGDFIGVRDDNERHTVRFLNTGEHLHNVAEFTLSRFPVGSSASRMEG